MLIPFTAEYPQHIIVQYYETKQSPVIIGIDSSGAQLDKRSIQALQNTKPFGVVLMRKNIQSYEQTKSLIESIHQYGRTLGIRIRVAVDEEGGSVSRLNHLPEYPKAFNGVSNFSEDLQKQHAKFLKDLGFDINFAPVADVGYEEGSIVFNRSFSSDENAVSNWVASVIRNQKEVGVESTLKHFPGHGRVKEDSHHVAAATDTSLEEWLEKDSKPFRTGIENNVENIMTGHITFTQVDSGNATVSEKWLKDILRNQLGFKGRIISDDLKMHGLNVKGVKDISCPGSQKTYQITDEDDSDLNAVKIKMALDAGVTNPLIILQNSETSEVFNKWITIEKQCL